MQMQPQLSYPFLPDKASKLKLIIADPPSLVKTKGKGDLASGRPTREFANDATLR
jgi:hypothetical protein